MSVSPSGIIRRYAPFE